MKPFAVQVAQRTCIGSRSRNEDFIAIEHLMELTGRTRGKRTARARSPFEVPNEAA
jgi:hypothetical protein